MSARVLAFSDGGLANSYGILESVQSRGTSAEFMHEHGLVDMIVERRDLRDRLATLLGYLLP